MPAGQRACRQPDPHPPRGARLPLEPVLQGRGRRSGHAVFAGKIIVHQDAQKTNAYQKNDNLLLSDDAEIDTKPELEIYADDVKCSHGATVRRPRPDRAVLSALARALPRRRGQEPADLRLRRRGHRALRRRQRAPSRRASSPRAAAGRPPAWRSWCDRAASPGRRAPGFDVERDPRDFPILADADERPAAGLSRHAPPAPRSRAR